LACETHIVLVRQAETSITIDDVTHVIDSCHVKETRFSPQSSTSVFLGPKPWP
jgi:HrpA-like RNA helicase